MERVVSGLHVPQTLDLIHGTSAACSADVHKRVQRRWGGQQSNQAITSGAWGTLEAEVLAVGGKSPMRGESRFIALAIPILYAVDSLPGF